MRFLYPSILLSCPEFLLDPFIKGKVFELAINRYTNKNGMLSSFVPPIVFVQMLYMGKSGKTIRKTFPLNYLDLTKLKTGFLTSN